MEVLPGDGEGVAENADAGVRRAVEAMLMVALDPVPPNLLAQLLEVATDEVERICSELAAA